MPFDFPSAIPQGLLAHPRGTADLLAARGAPGSRSAPRRLGRSLIDVGSLRPEPEGRRIDARPPFLATLPQVKARLTSSLQLRPDPPSRPSRKRARASLCGAPSPRRSRPRAELANRSLTSPVTCPVLTPGEAERFLLQARTASSAVASTTTVFPGPGRLPPTSAPEGARHSPATLPPRDELPTRVHPGSLSRSRARPLGRRRLFACGAPTGHRPLADFCNRNDPRARPTSSPNPAHPA